jgi:serine protease Do
LGIGLRGKEEDFVPYIMQSNVALTQVLPQRTGISQHRGRCPGIAVFHRDGAFAGLATSSFGQSFLQFSRSARGNPIVLVNVEESSVFWLAEESVPHFGRIPRQVSGRPLAWLGAYGLEPMDREVAKFLNLSAASGAVVSEVLESSPAEKAGLRDRDIILAIDGKPLPTSKPDRVVVAFLEREVDRRAGEVMTLSVLRGTERLEIKATLSEQPKIMREAERKHFERLGFTARELVYGDAIERRVKVSEAAGVIVNDVKQGSPAALAGLQARRLDQGSRRSETRSFAAAVRVGGS